VSFNANIFNLFDKDLRKYRLLPWSGTPTWVSE
jgi:outer membrane receptor for ferrienterochelin and colicins